MRLKFKIPLILFAAYSILVGLLITITLVSSSEVNRESQYQVAITASKWRSDVVRGHLEAKIAQLKALEVSVLAVIDLNDSIKAENLKKILYSMSNQPDVSDVYVVFERGAVFSAELTDPEKYYNIDVFHPASGGEVEIAVEETSDVNDDDDWYHIPKNTGKLHLTEPYKWKYQGETEERTMITLSNPLFINKKFVGVVGIDLELHKLQKALFDGFKNNEVGTYVAFISNEGLITAHPDLNNLLATMGEDLPPEKQKELLESIRSGKEQLIIKENLSTNEISLFPFVPMQPKGIDVPWSITYVTPLAALQGEELKVRNMSITIVLISTVFWMLFLIWLMANVFGGLTRTVETISKMTKGEGDLTIRLEVASKDEIGQMAKGLNMLIEKLHTTIKTTQREARSLLNTSSNLFGLSNKMLQSSETSLEQSAKVLKSTKESSENAKAIA
ncbi:MAG: methyl-accepting chemotaxis protein, partial [Fibromonadales bacterium]|nr:methyl-accepting chemotaxis protein [Fibromonadales bacterium]